MCEECNRARHVPGFAWFDVKCLHCGARLIRRLGSLDATAAEITKRRQKVLSDWMAFGHPEAQLRALAKTPNPVAPLPLREPKSKTK